MLMDQQDTLAVEFGMDLSKAYTKILSPILTLIKDFYRLERLHDDIQFIVHTMHQATELLVFSLL